MDKLVWYQSTEIVHALHKLLDNSQLHSLKEEELQDWPKATKCSVEEGSLPLIFREVFPSIADVLGVRRPLASTMLVVGLDEEEKAVKRTVEASLNCTTVWEIFFQGSLSFLQGTSGSSSSSMGRERSTLLMSIASTSKKVRTVSLPADALSQLASINPGEVIQEVSWSPSLQLSSSAREAYQRLLVGAKSVCKMYDVPSEK